METQEMVQLITEIRDISYQQQQLEMVNFVFFFIVVMTILFWKMTKSMFF